MLQTRFAKEKEEERVETTGGAGESRPGRRESKREFLIICLYTAYSYAALVRAMMS